MGTLHYIPAAGMEWDRHETAVLESLHATLLRDGHEVHCVRGVTQDGLPYWTLRDANGQLSLRIVRARRRYTISSHELGLSVRCLDLEAGLTPVRDRWAAKKAWNVVGSAV